MKKYLLLAFLCSSFLLSAQNSRITEQTPILIRFQAEVDGPQCLKNYNASNRNNWSVSIKRKVSDFFNIYLIEIEGNIRTKKLIFDDLRKESTVMKVGYDTPLTYRNIEPNDSDYPEQWNMKNVQADVVWEETTGGQTVNGTDIVIGILEKGFDQNHEDLQGNIWTNQAEIPDNGIDDDNNGFVDDFFGLNLKDLSDTHEPLPGFIEDRNHGTQVAGVIGAKGNNEIGVTGINWDANLLLFSKVEYAHQVIKAHEYAYRLRKKFNETNGSEGAFIVALNHSFGWSSFPEKLDLGVEMCEMIDSTGCVGILSVVSTENKDIDVDIQGDVLPNCNSDFLISVTSSNKDNEKARGSAYGKRSIDLAAPGENIFTLEPDNEYGFTSGTSFACPLVAGAIGLLYSLPCEKLMEDVQEQPAVSAKFMKTIILEGTQPITGFKEGSTSGGQLDVFESMQFIQAYCGKSDPTSNSLTILSPFPNPATSSLSFEYQPSNFQTHQLSISNALGQIVITKTIQPSRFQENVETVNVRYLASGIYFLILQSGEEVAVKRVVVD